MKKSLLYLLMGIGLIYVLFNSRCASTQTGPSGGPRDTIPPVLLRVSPSNQSLNFKANSFDLTFDEYVILKDVAKNVIVSPPSLVRPQIRTHAKGIRVRFNDTLKSNTTYTVNFGSAIEDINENNPFPAYRYVFSTGSYIDSMRIIGKVFDAYTLEPVENVSLMLYEEFKDSTVFQRIPDAYSRTDTLGYFSVDYIKPSPYAVVAIEDKNSNMRYDPGSEKIAFLDSLVSPVVMKKPLKDTLLVDSEGDTLALPQRSSEPRFYIYAEEGTRQTLSEYTLVANREIRLRFAQKNPQINSFHLDGIDSTGYVVETSRFRDTVTYWITAETLPDTLRGAVNYMRTDSTGNLSPTETSFRFPIKGKEESNSKKDKEDEEDKKESLNLNVTYNVPHELMEHGVKFYFPTLPVLVDPAKLLLEKKNVDGNEFEKVDIQWRKDTTTNRTYYLWANWIASTDYRLTMQPGAFADIYGLESDSTGYQFSAPNPDRYSSITLNLSNIGEQCIVQLLSEKKDKVLRENVVAKDGKIEYNYLQPEKYCIRFIEDLNQNGIWDPGKYLERRKPERVVFFSLANGSTLLELPLNSEIEQNIDVGELFEKFYK